MKVLLKGYYGQENLGDEAILAAMLLQLTKRNIGAVVSAGPHRSLFPEVFAICGTSAEVVNEDFWSELRTLPNVDALVVGGGGLFPRGRIGLPLRLLVLSLLFAMSGKPTFIVGVGVNPIRHGLTKFVWRLLATVTKGIAVRDNASFNVVEEAVGATLAGSKLVRSADTVFSIDPETFGRSTPDVTAKRLAIVLARPWNAQEHASAEGKRRFATLTEGIRRIAREVTSRGWHIDLVPFYSNADLKFAHEIIGDGLDNVHIVDDQTIRGRLSVLRSCSAVLTMRFHGLVFGALFDKPVAVIAYDHKMTELADELEISHRVVKLGMRDHEYFGFKADVDFDKLSEILGSMTLSPDTPEGVPGRAKLAKLSEKNFEAIDHFLKLRHRRVAGVKNS